MDVYRFSAYALPGELDLNRLAASLGIAGKLRWEEPLVLDPGTLAPPAGEPGVAQVCLYFFGSVVFVNCLPEAIDRFFSRMAHTSELFRDVTQLRFREEYELRIDGGAAPSIGNDFAVMPHLDRHFDEIICFVLAKSVALERIEERVDAALDEVESLITLLDRGKFSSSDRRLAKFASSILALKHRSIAYVMVLDKPDITWENPAADHLYQTLDNLFELRQRYREITHKSGTLMDIMEVFTGLSHARRATRLEWIIIILIAIEVVVYLLEILWHR